MNSSKSIKPHRKTHSFKFNYGQYKKKQIAWRMVDLLCQNKIVGLETLIDESSSARITELNNTNPIPTPKTSPNLNDAIENEPKTIHTSLASLLARSNWWELKRQLLYLTSYNGLGALALLPSGQTTPAGKIIYNIVTIDPIIYYGSEFAPTEMWGYIDNPVHFPKKRTMSHLKIAHIYLRKVNINGVLTDRWWYEISTSMNLTNGEAVELIANANVGDIPDLLKNKFNFNREGEVYDADNEFVGTPIQIFQNTYNQLADHERIDNDVYAALDYYSEQIDIEYRMLRNNLQINEARLGGNYKAADVMRKILQEDDRSIPFNSNSYTNEATPITPVITKPDAYTLTLANFQFWEDYVDREANSMMSVVGTGTNKHNLENIKVDEDALKYLTGNKIPCFLEQLQLFFNQLVIPILSLRSTNKQPLTALEFAWPLNSIDYNKIVASDTTFAPRTQLAASMARSVAREVAPLLSPKPGQPPVPTPEQVNAEIGNLVNEPSGVSVPNLPTSTKAIKGAPIPTTAAPLNAPVKNSKKS